MRIIRFENEHRQILWGEPQRDGDVLVLHGSIEGGFERTTQRVKIAKLLAPLEAADILCIGRNYCAIGDPAGSDRREDPDSAGRPDDTLEVFLKPSTAIQHPNDPIIIPAFAGIDPQLDCEGELAIVIGLAARHVSEADALEHVFGYTIANDVTARHFQTASGPPLWMRGKGFDTFCPLGPAIITRDEIDDVQSLAIRTIINGQVVREGNTRDMIRYVPQIIAALSRHMTLRTGSIVLTGAPPATPAQLTHGDQIQVEIESIGSLRNITT